jgi:dTDP-4-dehydrorhamnose reductase
MLVQPTWSPDLAASLLTLPEGITHHMAADTTSWYGFALAVQARIGRGAVAPVRMEELGLAEPRPRDARLAPAKLPGWRERLHALLR